MNSSQEEFGNLNSYGDNNLSNKEKEVRKKQCESKRKQRASYSDSKKEEERKKERERKRIQRAAYSEDEKRKQLEKQRIYQRERRANFTADKKQKELKQAKIYGKERRANLTSEEKQIELEKGKIYRKERRANLTTEEKQNELNQHKVYQEKRRANLTTEEKQNELNQHKVYQQKRRANLTTEEKQNELNQLKDNQRKRRANQRNDDYNEHQRNCVSAANITCIEHDISCDVDNVVVDLCSNIEMEESIRRCRANLTRTQLQEDEYGFKQHHNIHQILVCVVCDRCIIGTDAFYWIGREILKFHEQILSSTYYYKEGINTLLKQQYTIDDDLLSHLLLSPRARRKKSDGSLMSCEDCYKVLCDKKGRSTPPKFGISNGFAIGHLPEDISKNVTPLVNNLVAPVRAFNFFVSFNGGREQKITGNFTFFSQDVSQNMGALQHTCLLNNNPSVFILLLGSFTPIQLQKIKKQGTLSLQSFEIVYKFLHENNYNYSNLPSIHNVPRPTVEEIRMNEDDAIEISNCNPSIEEHICWRYWFPNIEDPNCVRGSFQNQGEFAKALFIGETPTLIYHPTKIMSYARLSQICPIAFPFGTGDVDCKRSPRVSEIECLQHYLRLSLPQFQEGQTVLIIHHIYQRRKSFLTGITKCNVSNNGNTIADQLAEMTVNELDEAISQMKNASNSTNNNNTVHTSSNVAQFLRCVKTSCAPIGYTNEAATNARNKMFALWMTFGPPSLLFTFSPCDECSFRMNLYALGKEVELPSLRDSLEVMSRNLGLRKSLRVRYPGACAREFDSLLRIVVNDLIGWQGNKQTHCGIFGKILCHSIGVEEQGRTTLHGHIILWVSLFRVLQQQLFSSDVNVRNRAITQIQNYMSQVLSSSFEVTETEVNQSLHICRPEELCGTPLQNLREMRHRQLLKKHTGKIITCNKCEKQWETVEIINSIIGLLLDRTRQECPTYWPENLVLPLGSELMELLALRYQYDITDIPIEADTLRRLLHLVVLMFFNTHDWRHRKACFKKGNECRFHIPFKPCNTLKLTYKTDDVEGIVSGISSDSSCKWYHLDGSYHNICSYDIQTKRDLWDVFVNTNNPVITEIFGYNNNICMGSINTLFYCTLYTSKSNQEEETFPFMRACEAVSTRIKKLNETDGESNLSMRQIGLRRLLSGINAHLSSCVVSATMAWYLVTHGTRFHFSHDFKPLLLSQLESWYEGKGYSRRIRYKKKARKSYDTHDRCIARQVCLNSEVWFDSDVNNYIFRPSIPKFDNMSIWEYQSKYDMITFKPENFMKEDQEYDDSEQHYRFNEGHPGYQYSCLVKRTNEIIPQLYYSNKFPDIEMLEVQKGDDVNESVKLLRETYALKALLLFLPYKTQNDLLCNNNNLWNSFLQKKEQYYQNELSQQPSLYKHSIQILQNIQDLLNVKKIPITEDSLESCTHIFESDMICESFRNQSSYDGVTDEEGNCNFEAAVDELSHFVNILSQDSSIFNDNLNGLNTSMLDPSLNKGIISIESSNFESINICDGNNNEDIQQNASPDLYGVPHFRQPQSIITVLTKALQRDDHHISVTIPSCEMGDLTTLNGETINLCSLCQFAVQNQLDAKQTKAFQTICSSFMLSYLSNDSTIEILPHERQTYQSLLKQKGGKDQLCMFLTGPGGSGKSHLINCCRIYCKAFCDAVGKPFDFSVFPITATSNSAASLLNGITIHSAALLNNRVVDIQLSSEVNWAVTKILIIDEISMAQKSMLRDLDKNLRILTGNRDLMYGGIHIVFIGDFLQLPPVNGNPIYADFDDIHWHGSLNACIFLDQKNHRFKDDTEWGELLTRVQNGSVTDQDIEKINSRLVDHVQLPELLNCKDTRITYACYTNKRRNLVTNECFKHFVSQHNPKFDSSVQPSTNAIIIKGIITKDGGDVGMEFHKYIWALCGDDNLNGSNQQKVDPCLKLFTGCPLMINTNTEKSNKIFKGTLGSFVGLRWKEGCGPHIENYHGYKVFAATVADIGSILFELPNKKIIEIRPEVFSVSINLPWIRKQLKGFKILQFAVNIALAVTGHKLQGMTKDILIVAEFTNRVPNWLYVVLSRVTSLNGLYLLQPLEKGMFKKLPKNIEHELKWLRVVESKCIAELEN